MGELICTCCANHSWNRDCSSWHKEWEVCWDHESDEEYLATIPPPPPPGPRPVTTLPALRWDVGATNRNYVRHFLTDETVVDHKIPETDTSYRMRHYYGGPSVEGGETTVAAMYDGPSVEGGETTTASLNAESRVGASSLSDEGKSQDLDAADGVGSPYSSTVGKFAKKWMWRGQGSESGSEKTTASEGGQDSEPASSEVDWHVCGRCLGRCYCVSCPSSPEGRKLSKTEIKIECPGSPPMRATARASAARRSSTKTDDRQRVASTRLPSRGVRLSGDVRQKTPSRDDGGPQSDRRPSSIHTSQHQLRKSEDIRRSSGGGVPVEDNDGNRHVETETITEPRSSSVSLRKRVSIPYKPGAGGESSKSSVGRRDSQQQQQKDSEDIKKDSEDIKEDHDDVSNRSIGGKIIDSMSSVARRTRNLFIARQAFVSGIDDRSDYRKEDGDEDGRYETGDATNGGYYRSHEWVETTARAY